MPLLNNSELINMKLLIIKDLEKTLKKSYEHQYKNILSKIVSNKKRFIKRRLPEDISEDIRRYDSLAAGLSGYLTNIFDVFGDNAVLNAKKTFEENGQKWGKKLRKKLVPDANENDIKYIIKRLYINVPEIDYIEMSESRLIWHFSMLGSSSNEVLVKLHPKLYDIKAAWLNSFIKAFTSQYAEIFELKNGDDNKKVTGIELKKESKCGPGRI